MQALLPLRHERMSASAFAFYRGGAAVMANDLGPLPSSGLVTQLCGDAHLSNFGVFAAPDRSLVFDVNDFDETHPGPFEWDVFRLATSFVLAGRDIGLPAEAIAAAATAAASAYRVQMQTYAGTGDLATWYDRVNVDTIMQLAKDQGIGRGKQMEKAAAKARTRTSWSAIEKMTQVVDGERRFLDLPPLLMPMPVDGPIREVIELLIDQYRETLPHDRKQLLLKYHVIDMAHKVVGVGSVGLLAFVILMQGRDPDDLLVLQAKQAVHSVLEPFTSPALFPMRGAGRRRPAAHAGGIRHLPRLGARWCRARLLHPAAARHEVLARSDDVRREPAARLRTAVRADAGTRACARRRRGGDLGLPGHQRQVRRRGAGLLARLRRPGGASTTPSTRRRSPAATCRSATMPRSRATRWC